MKLFEGGYGTDFEEEFIRALYVGVLARDPRPNEVAEWLPFSRTKRSLTDMVAAFVASEEAKSRIRADQKLFVPPGHFYSPIVNVSEIASHPLADTSPPPGAVAGISLNGNAMQSFWVNAERVLQECDFPEVKVEGRRYHFENGAFSYGDALTYYMMLRRWRPKQIIEIGAGYSSACALDTIERHLGGKVKATFIDPYPQLILELLEPEERQRVEIIDKAIQQVAPALFDQLGQDDILFIDSTHVSKTGSDVNHELFSILPHLNQGVLIHFHDIFFPFEYGHGWAVDENRSWNEAYALRAFLMYNEAFEILFFNDYFAKLFRPDILRIRPDFLKNPGGSIWLRKISPALPRP
jgi:hypothetical protein